MKKRVVVCPDACQLPSISCEREEALSRCEQVCYVSSRRYPFLLPNLFGASAALLMLPLVFFCLPETRTRTKDARNDAVPVPNRYSYFPKAFVRATAATETKNVQEINFVGSPLSRNTRSLKAVYVHAAKRVIGSSRTHKTIFVDPSHRPRVADVVHGRHGRWRRLILLFTSRVSV